MREPLSKPCKLCSQPVTPKRRKDRKSWSYPKQCKDCFRRLENPEGARVKKSLASSGLNNPRALPMGSKKIVKRRGVCYYQIKVKESGKDNWEYEHRIVMSTHLGRQLSSKEIVHHKDKNGLNNCLDNLEVLSIEEHNTHHHSLDSDKWSRLYDSCKNCGDDNRKHSGYGLCSLCYQREWKERLGVWR